SATADYQPASGTLNFAAGEIEKRITVLILDDALGEGNESFSLTLTNAVGIDVTDQAAATVVIVDDESAVAFSSSVYQVSENQPTAILTVTRTGSAANPFSVDYTTSDGTAIAGQDYVAQNGTLNFASGETNKT